MYESMQDKVFGPSLILYDTCTAEYIAVALDVHSMKIGDSERREHIMAFHRYDSCY